ANTLPFPRPPRRRCFHLPLLLHILLCSSQVICRQISHKQRVVGGHLETSRFIALTWKRLNGKRQKKRHLLISPHQREGTDQQGENKANCLRLVLMRKFQGQHPQPSSVSLLHQELLAVRRFLKK